MRHTIRNLASQGRSVLVSSHLLSEMQLTADRLVVIGKGRMIGEYSMDEFLAGGARVLVETPDARLTDTLATRLRDAGFTASFGLADDTGGTDAGTTPLTVDIPEGSTDAEVRRAVAEIALTARVPVTGLRAETANLETRFLAATADAQEYRTESATSATSATSAVPAAPAGKK
jgi:ABC-2 type transport system ATP-binding protein